MERIQGDNDSSLIKNAFLLFDKMSELQKKLPVAYALFQVVENERHDGAVDAKYLYANERFCRGIGHDKDDLVGHLVTETYEDETTKELFYYAFKAAYRGEESNYTTYSKTLGHWAEFIIAPTNISGCCVVVCTFIDDSHLERELLRRNSTTDDAIVRISRLLSNEDDYDTVMNQVLLELSRVIHSERIYILSTDRVVVDLEFEWCNEGIPTHREKLSKLSYQKYFGNWEKYLNRDRAVIKIDDIDIFKEHEKDVYENLKDRGIQRFVCAPFYDNKHQILGFLCADNYEIIDDIDTRKIIESISCFIGFRIRNHTLMKLLDYRGTHDDLTGLKNRRVFGEALKAVSQTRDTYGIYYVDLNFFKYANDNYGHHVGNEVLQETAIRLRDASRHEVFRLGGDEFAILIDEELPEEEYKKILEDMDAAFKVPILDTKDYRITISVSAGYAIAPTDSTSPNELRKIADQRMYEKKKLMHEKIISEGGTDPRG